MPPLPSPGQILDVQFSTEDDASINAGSRFFLRYTGAPPTAADLDTMASDVADAWADNIAESVHSTENLVQVKVTDLSSDTGAQGTWSGSKPGTASGTAIPSSICAVVNHQIDRRYRGGRPRTYLRVGTEGMFGANNQWTQTFADQFLSGWQGWIAAILALTGFGFTLQEIVNVSWYSGSTVFITPSGRARNIPTLRETPVVDSIVDSTVPVKMGSQRRRLNL